MSDKEKGFTLIELLIVVAIIGILAAIAIPAFLGQQKKAKWRSLLGSCEGASKQASAMLSDLAKLDPIVMLGDPATRVCYEHAMKTMVDTNANGAVDTPACIAKFNLTRIGTYSSTTLPITGFANAIAAEACGPNLTGAPLMDAVAANTSPTGGLIKPSPYRENMCLFVVLATAPASLGPQRGQCVIIPYNITRTMHMIAVEDRGDGVSAGETKAWVVAAD